jgi:serine/threonine-protein kinase
MGLAMEYVQGPSLEQRLQKAGRLPVAETLAVARAIAAALQAVHDAGLVHRDVKPANIVAAPSGYKLIDFGVAVPATTLNSSTYPASFEETPIDARLLGCSTIKLGSRCGTVGYIDPVCVARGDSATPASDLYALGATLFQCVVGLVPALAEKPGYTMPWAVLSGRRPAPSLAKLLPSLPKRFATLIDALLAPEPSARPPSAAALLEWLDEVA